MNGGDGTTAASPTRALAGYGDGAIDDALRSRHVRDCRTIDMSCRCAPLDCLARGAPELGIRIGQSPKHVVHPPDRAVWQTISVVGRGWRTLPGLIAAYRRGHRP